jgi:DegV family protein with EDD domain
MRIVMDDVGDIPAELLEKHNIGVVPVNVIFGTEEYLSGVTIDHATFYEKADQVTAENFPKTAQPTPFQFAEFYKKILAEGEDEILTITVSEKLSGTYASAVQAQKELAGQGALHLFDSQSGSAPMGYMVLEAARMAEAGASAAEILARLRQMRQEMVVIFTIDSLEYAVKGGRVSSMRSLMASLLNIKPIVHLSDGEILELGKVRTRKRAIREIVELVRERADGRPVKFATIHANAPADAERLYELARPQFEVTEEMMVDMAIPVAINLGPGALGLSIIPEKEG